MPSDIRDPSDAVQPERGYYQWAKVVAIGAVVAGTTMFSRRCDKSSPPPGKAPDNA